MHQSVDQAEDRTNDGRTRRSWKLALGALVAIAVAGAASLLLRPAGRSEGVVPGNVAMPRLQAPGELRLDDLRGSPVVVNFWASWCDPCRREMPLLEEIAQANPGIEVVGIDVQDTREAALGFLESIEVSYPAVQDLDQDVFRPLYRAAGLPDYLPQTYFITADGELLLEGDAAPKLGEYDDVGELQAAVDALLDVHN